MEKHVGIMLYFDNFHRVESLPDDQLGLLFRALMACGEAELAGRDGITGFETRYPAMGERTQMAFAFMADNIRRDAAAGVADALEAEGWVCWDETASAIPEAGTGASSHANAVIRAIPAGSQRAYLTLDAGTESARVLPTLLTRLEARSYAVSVPLETRL